MHDRRGSEVQDLGLTLECRSNVGEDRLLVMGDTDHEGRACEEHVLADDDRFRNIVIRSGLNDAEDGPIGEAFELRTLVRPHDLFDGEGMEFELGPEFGEFLGCRVGNIYPHESGGLGAGLEGILQLQALR